jgi:hypothetical protein
MNWPEPEFHCGNTVKIYGKDNTFGKIASVVYVPTWRTHRYTILVPMPNRYLRFTVYNKKEAQICKVADKTWNDWGIEV